MNDDLVRNEGSEFDPLAERFSPDGPADAAERDEDRLPNARDAVGTQPDALVAYGTVLGQP